MPELNIYPSRYFSQCTHATIMCNLVFEELFFTGGNGHKCVLWGRAGRARAVCATGS